MLTKLAAALIAVTMFTAPVLAQSAAPVSNVPVQQIKAKPAVKHVKIKKHTVKKATVTRHRTHIKHVRHSAKSSHTARVSTKSAPLAARPN
jgi:hypothetical protein